MCKIDWISQYDMTRGSVTGGYIMKKTLKKLTALATVVALAATIFVANPISVQAKNSWIDGDTPEKYDNRVKTSFGTRFRPTVRTNFHASSLKAFVPTSPQAEFDLATGVNTSLYEDAYSCVFVGNNSEYGELARASLDGALSIINGGTYITTFTLNILLHEGGVYKLVPNSPTDLEFKMAVPKSMQKSGRDFAVIRLNPEGTVTFLTDLDTDPLTVTIRTNYFAPYNVYAYVYGNTGAFDAYKPVIIPASNVPTIVPANPIVMPVAPAVPVAQ